jgi:phosphotransferase system HPr-like phosphotransfer protein
MLPKIIAHFVVTNPLGMHARVCSKWIKTIQKIEPSAGDEPAIWILYNNEKIPAGSLFKLLETRIPCGAEFDLLTKVDIDCDKLVLEELNTILSKQSVNLSL